MSEIKELSQGEKFAQFEVIRLCGETDLTVEIKRAEHDTPYFVYYFYRNNKIFEVVGGSEDAVYWAKGYHKAFSRRD